jgi:hypothetical protein
MPPVRGLEDAFRASSCSIRGENFGDVAGGREGCGVERCDGGSSAWSSFSTLPRSEAEMALSMSGVGLVSHWSFGHVTDESLQGRES